jgi:hypothetical protein
MDKGNRIIRYMQKPHKRYSLQKNHPAEKCSAFFKSIHYGLGKKKHRTIKEQMQGGVSQKTHNKQKIGTKQNDSLNNKKRTKTNFFKEIKRYT